MSNWAIEKSRQEYERYIKGLIKLSQMVEDGALSSSGARKVFSKYYDNYQQNLEHIKQIDKYYG